MNTGFNWVFLSASQLNGNVEFPVSIQSLLQWPEIKQVRHVRHVV